MVARMHDAEDFEVEALRFRSVRSARLCEGVAAIRLDSTTRLSFSSEVTMARPRMKVAVVCFERQFSTALRRPPFTPTDGHGARLD